MNKIEYLTLLQEIKSVAFATVDSNGNPQVRIIDIMLIEDEKIYFVTARGKDFYQQITAFNKVAITGLTTRYQMIRVQGEVNKEIEQIKWIDKIFQYNPSMNDVYPKESRYILEVFYLEQIKMEYFDLGTQPIVRTYYKDQNCPSHCGGYRIDTTCIACGRCANQCPQNCIVKQESYVIQQKHCLHCGLCVEVCPVQAIKKDRG